MDQPCTKTASSDLQKRKLKEEVPSDFPFIPPPAAQGATKKFLVRRQIAGI